MRDEYVSRAAALKDFDACNARNPVWTPGRVKTLLLRQPTAYVGPSRTGYWKGWHGDTLVGIDDCGRDIYRHYRYYECSECFTRNAIKSNYCPCCGAKMNA